MTDWGPEPLFALKRTLERAKNCTTVLYLPSLFLAFPRTLVELPMPTISVIPPNASVSLLTQIDFAIFVCHKKTEYLSVLSRLYFMYFGFGSNELKITWDILLSYSRQYFNSYAALVVGVAIFYVTWFDDNIIDESVQLIKPKNLHIYICTITCTILNGPFESNI